MGRPQEARSGEEKEEEWGGESNATRRSACTRLFPAPGPTCHTARPGLCHGQGGPVWFGQEGELKARILGSDERDVPRAGSRGVAEAPPPPARPGPWGLPLSSHPMARGAQGGVLGEHWGRGEGHRGQLGALGPCLVMTGGLGMPSAASSPRLQPQLSAAHTPPGRQALPPLLLANLPYGKLQDFLGQKGGGWSQDWSRPTPHGGWLVSRP